MLETLKCGHPRLFTDDFSRIIEKCRNSEYVRSMYEHVKNDCDAIISDPDFKIKGNELIKALIKASKLALVYKITDDFIYKKEAVSCVRRAHEVIHELMKNAVTPVLSIGMAGQTAATVYDWLYNDLSDDEKNLMRHILKEHIIEYLTEDFKPEYNDPYSKRDTLWTRDYNNVQHVACSGGILSCLAVGDEYPDLCENLMDKLINRAYNVDLYRHSGVYPEGQYWNYSIYAIVLGLSAMENALGTDFGISGRTGLSETGYYNIASTGPADGFQLKFSDANPDIDRRVHNNPAMIWMGNKYNRPEYIWWEKRVTDRGEEFRFPDRVMSIIWYDESKDTYIDYAPSFPLLNVLDGPNEMMIEDIEAYASVITIRDEWFNKDSAWIGMKAGGNPTHHGHIDVGNFMIVINDVDWLCELGWESYSKKGQFDFIPNLSPWHRDSPRWLYYRNRAEGHNTLVINPGEVPTEQMVPSYAPVTGFGNDKEKGFAVIDMTELYKDAISIKRGIKLLHGQNTIIVQDEISYKKECDLYWFAHTRAEIEIIDKKIAKLRKDGKEIYAILKTQSGKGEWSVREAKRFECSPKPIEPDSENEGIKKLCINLKMKEDTVCVVFSESVRDTDITCTDDWKQIKEE